MVNRMNPPRTLCRLAKRQSGDWRCDGITCGPTLPAADPPHLHWTHWTVQSDRLTLCDLLVSLCSCNRGGGVV